MKKIYIIIVTVFIFIFTITFLSCKDKPNFFEEAFQKYPQFMPNMPNIPREERFKSDRIRDLGFPFHIIRQLDLTDEQLTKISDIKIEEKKKVIENRSLVNIKLLELKSIQRKDDFKIEDAQKIADEIGKLEAEFIMNRIKVRSNIMNVLTKEQKYKLKKIELSDENKRCDD